MAKCLVCIMEEELTTNYLFVKELLETGDEILLITQKKLEAVAAQFRHLFPATQSVEILALEQDGDEDFWDTICQTILRKLPATAKNYHVNLSGGTRLMSIAVQQIFERFGAKFFFVPQDRNVIINSQIDDNIENNDDLMCEIRHQMDIEEYFRVNQIQSHHKEPMKRTEYTQHFFTLFTQHHLSDSDFDILDELREQRNRTVAIDDVHGLKEFLHYIDFPQDDPQQLYPHEVQYLTGNWFEEYIYHTIKATINPTDIAIGVDIQRIGSDNHNDLDVVFTYKNRLFAIECKTGVGRASLYHQIVYKACALKEALLGLRSNGYIFSLNNDHRDKLQRTARNMGILFCDREYAEEPSRLRNLFLNPKMYL